MGIPSEMRDFWAKRRETLLIPSAVEERKISNARHCTQVFQKVSMLDLRPLPLRASPAQSPRVETEYMWKSVVIKGPDCIYSKTFPNGFQFSYVGLSEITTNGPVKVVYFFEVPLIAVRVVPWAKVNLNYTAQALLISAASIAAFFITADKTILECARRNSQLDEELRRQS